MSKVCLVQHVYNGASTGAVTVAVFDTKIAANQACITLKEKRLKQFNKIAEELKHHEELGKTIEITSPPRARDENFVIPNYIYKAIHHYATTVPLDEFSKSDMHLDLEDADDVETLEIRYTFSRGTIINISNIQTYISYNCRVMYEADWKQYGEELRSICNAHTECLNAYNLYWGTWNRRRNELQNMKSNLDDTEYTFSVIDMPFNPIIK